MDFKTQNDLDRKYFSQNFSEVNELLNRIRQSLKTGKPLETKDLKLAGIYDYDPNLSFTYITVFQEGLTPVRYGSRRKTMSLTLNRDIEKLRENKNFHFFEFGNS